LFALSAVYIHAHNIFFARYTKLVCEIGGEASKFLCRDKVSAAALITHGASSFDAAAVKNLMRKSLHFIWPRALLSAHSPDKREQPGCLFLLLLV
jgi:hypothetical protein